VKTIARSLAIAVPLLYSQAFAGAPMPVKGTVCYSKSLRPAENNRIACAGIGEFPSVEAIYAAGFRVVSSGVIQEAGGSTIFLIIEERK